MKKTRTMTLTMMALAGLLVVTVAPAGARGRDSTGPPAQEPTGGTTCEVDGAPTGADDPIWDGDAGESGFEITLNAEDDYACVDVLWATAGKWQITVTGEGARSLTLVPRDSVAPGDSCGGAMLRRDAVYGVLTLPLDEDTRNEIPAGYVNACGVEYAEWVHDLDVCNAVLKDGSDSELPCLITTVHTEHAHPLVFQAFLGGGKNATATIHVTLPQPQP